jgi:hypothetical protein
MTASGIKLLDANVWLALAFGDHVHHAAARTWFDLQADGTCALCRITQLALLRHLTNAKIMGPFVQNQQQAWAAFDSFHADPRVAFLSEPVDWEVRFRQFSQSTTPAHQRWTDAYLAAVSQGCGATLVTFDRGFKSFPGLSLELLA